MECLQRVVGGGAMRFGADRGGGEREFRLMDEEASGVVALVPAVLAEDMGTGGSVGVGLGAMKGRKLWLWLGCGRGQRKPKEPKKSLET